MPKAANDAADNVAGKTGLVERKKTLEQQQAQHRKLPRGTWHLESWVQMIALSKSAGEQGKAGCLE
jgi:hypothetical protein